MSLLIKRVAAYFCIMPLPPAPALRLSPSQHQELMKITSHPSAPQAIVLRCRVVLGAAKGIANNELARQLSTSLPTVLLWRRRFQQQGWLAILEDQHRSGRPRSLTPEKEAAIVEATRNTKPHNATHWSVRSMARSQGVSSATIQRIWKAYHLQPHRVEHFKFSTDPEFVRKVRDIVGLYLNLPDRAVVFSLDEKSPWIAPNPFCRYARDCPSDRPMITNAMERPLCSRPSTSYRER